MDFVVASILGGLIGGGIWLIFIKILGGSIALPGVYNFLLKIDKFFRKTLKIPLPILHIVYYLGFCYLFMKFIHVIIIIAEQMGY